MKPTAAASRYLPITLLPVFVALLSSQVATANESEEHEVCFHFDPALYVSSDMEATAFGECFKEAFNTDHANFMLESVELQYEEDDGEGDTGNRILGNKRNKSNRVKGKGKCNKSCQKELLHGDHLNGRRLGDLHGNGKKWSLREGAVRSVGRVLDTGFPSKSYTEYLLDDCVHFVNAYDGLLGDLAGGVSITPCAS